MTTRSHRHRNAEDESRAARPDRRQGFVRGRDLADAKSQAEAPRQATHALDRSGEKRYAADLRQFEQANHPAAAPPATDAPLTELVRQVLRAQIPNDADAIEVEVTGGLAVLSGWVTSDAARGRAEDVILRISGIGDVLNQLEVSERTTKD